MYYVYILKGTRYYVGSTQDMERRMKEDKRGHTHTTKRIGEFQLEGYFELESKEEAIKLEREIKKSGHIEKWIERDGFKRIVE